MSDGSTSDVLDEIAQYADTNPEFDDSAKVEDCLALFIERAGLAGEFKDFIAAYVAGEVRREPFDNT